MIRSHVGRSTPNQLVCAALKSSLIPVSSRAHSWKVRLCHIGIAASRDYRSGFAACSRSEHVGWSAGLRSRSLSSYFASSLGFAASQRSSLACSDHTRQGPFGQR
jgi:hypothetical protein